MADVFISYCRADRELVLPLVDTLKELGLDIWFDLVLHNGSDFSDEINEELKTARAVLVCWSANAAASHWVKAEAHIGLEHNKLAACFLTPCSLWPPFNIVQTEDLHGWKGDWSHPGFQTLLDRVGTLVRRPGLRDLCAAHSDPTGSRLASWASTFSEDPAAPSVWPIWERRQREEFRRTVEDVKRTIVEQSKRQLSKAASKLSSTERDFETWLARGKDAVKHRRPDPTAILHARAEDASGVVASNQTHVDPAISRRKRTAFAASVVAALLAGSVVAWLGIKATSPADAGIVQLETKLKAVSEKAESERRALTVRLERAESDAAAYRKRAITSGEMLKTADMARAQVQHELQAVKLDRDEVLTKLNEMLQTKARSAVNRFYTLHTFDKSNSTLSSFSKSVSEIYASKLIRNGFEVEKHQHIDDLESDFYNKFEKFGFILNEKSFDYSKCTDQKSCVVRGNARSISSKSDKLETPSKYDFKFALKFDLRDQLKVTSECTQGPSQAPCE